MIKQCVCVFMCAAIFLVCAMPSSAVYDGITYQGKVLVNDEPFSGTGNFQFAIVDESSSQYYWSNDGVFPPALTVNLTVTDGIFSVILGDPPMQPLLSSQMLNNSDLVLRIWFDDGTTGNQLLTPDQKITSTMFAGKASEAGYAEFAEACDDADTIDGFHYSVLWPTTLITVKAAASNDFHNLGGVDDDVPDYNEVAGSAIQNNAVDADKLAHDIDATGIGFNADKVDGMDAADFAEMAHDHWGESWTGSDIGLELSGGTMGLSGTGSMFGVSGLTSSTNGSGVYGLNSSTTGLSKGVYGRSESTAGVGVFGYGSTTNGITTGVYGLASSTSGRGIYGSATASTGSTQGVYGKVESDQGKAIYGYAGSTTGETYGVWGQTMSTEGNGVYGYSAATSGTGNGVYGKTNTNFGAGVYGEGNTYGVQGKTTSSTGRGVYGVSNSSTGSSDGVKGENSSSSGNGVSGISTSTTGSPSGVYGKSRSTTGRGVYGEAEASTGTNYGVYGKTASTSGCAVYGETTSTTGYNYAIRGVTNSVTGHAVYGEAVATSGLTFGVYGKINSSTGYGVYGWSNANSGDGYGVFGRGDSLTGAGVVGQNWTNGAGVQAYSYNGHSLECFSGEPPTGNLRFYVDQSGNAYADGSHQTFKQTGTTDDGKLECTTMESISSTGSWFEDFGFVEFNGSEIKVEIDPEFAAMANLEMTYHVFLTQEGGFCPIYIAERTPEYFVIQTNGAEECNVSVHYRLVAKRRGSEHKRMEKIIIPASTVSERSGEDMIAQE